MPTRLETYRQELQRIQDVEGYLPKHSGLPGPRGNLGLAHAFAQVGEKAHILRWSSLSPDKAPENTPDVFLAFCDVLGLARLLASGEAEAEARLVRLADDP